MKATWWALHRPYQNGTWAGAEACGTSLGGILMFESEQAALDHRMQFGTSDQIPWPIDLSLPQLGGHVRGMLAEGVISLDRAGPNKIAIIKLVRELTGLGLKEAKDLVESPPPVLIKVSPNFPNIEEKIQEMVQAGAILSP